MAAYPEPAMTSERKSRARTPVGSACAHSSMPTHASANQQASAGRPAGEAPSLGIVQIDHVCQAFSDRDVLAQEVLGRLRVELAGRLKNLHAQSELQAALDDLAD